ncbi:MAG: response regulator receiver protein, partial [Nonomuraea muscovyensis]|nr:response regulator receiver protein [Nonomuraea muscovyensis]
MIKILVVDDEPQMLRALRINLVARHYEVALAADGGAALRVAAEWHPDLVVLDLGLPDIDGVEVIHGLRGWTNVPIVVLSGRAGSADKIEALDAGADDYVTKPFGIDEFLARIRAVSRRATVQEAELARIRLGDHVVDLTTKTISPAVRLTPTEWHILELLLRNPGKLIPQRYLLTEVWGSSYV